MSLLVVPWLLLFAVTVGTSVVMARKERPIILLVMPWLLLFAVTLGTSVVMVIKNSEEQSLSPQADRLEAELQVEYPMADEEAVRQRQFESSVARGTMLSGKAELREELYTYYGRPCLAELAELVDRTIPSIVWVIADKKLEYLHAVFTYEQIREMNAMIQTVEDAGIYTMNFKKRKDLYDSMVEECLNFRPRGSSHP